MKITRLNELADVAPIEVTQAPPLPEPLTDEWLVTARQAVADAQAVHAQVVADIATITASLAKMRIDRNNARAELTALEQLPTGSLTEQLAAIENSAAQSAAATARCEILSRKIPLLEKLLAEAETKETPTRWDARDARDAIWTEYAARIDLSGALAVLTDYRSACSATGHSGRFRDVIHGLTNRDKPVVAATRRLTAMLAIPGEMVVDDDDEAPTVAPMADDDVKVLEVLTVGMDASKAIVGYAPPETGSMEVSLEYTHDETRAIYAARTLANAA